jgi:hydroxymethylpyrimidine pyrophosphatase-like HAD family hydrolase
MVLPPGVNKATGLLAALDEMELSAHNVVGVGDAENDHSFLHVCGCAAAVANAVEMIKEQSRGPCGAPTRRCFPCIAEQVAKGSKNVLLAH